MRQYRIKDSKIDYKTLALQETIFHNANGYLGVRGTLEEGCPADMDTMRGMYLNGFCDVAPMKQAEKLCNLVEDKEILVNVADTQGIRASFNGVCFSQLDPGVTGYERVLDMDRGVTERYVDWRMPSGERLTFAIRRMTSFTERRLFIMDYRFTSVDFTGEVELSSDQKGIVQNYFNPNDPRLAGEQCDHLRQAGAYLEENKSCLVSETITSGLKVASSVGHGLWLNGEEQEAPAAVYDDKLHCTRFTARLHLCPGDTVRLVKYCALSDSRHTDAPEREASAVRDAAMEKGAQWYYEKQEEYLKRFWENCSLEIDGDDELNQSVSFNLYALLESAGVDGCSSIAAKGLSGEGYEGHYFWDTEMFMLPYFALTNPQIAKDILMFRYHTLPEARANAALVGHRKGALYPWRTINGTECSGYFPSGTAAYHINGDIAYAIVLYYTCTGDAAFIRDHGLEVMVETARLWMDVGHYADGTFRINCVTGPDEYTCMVNNNYFTNACARYNLEWCVRFAHRLRADGAWWESFCARLGLTEDELEAMGRAAEHMYLPYDEALGINPQDDSFLQKPVWDLEKTDPAKFPLLLHYHPLHLYRYQVCKQADTVLAHFLFPDYQDQETMRRSFLYYEKITTHDSSLSTCVFSMQASRLGMKDKAYAYFGDSAKLDLMNTHDNTKDGIHAANMGGCYMAIVYGFAGVRLGDEVLSLSPSLPQKWRAYRFRIQYRGSLLEIAVNEEGWSVEQLGGAAVQIEADGERRLLRAGEKWTRSVGMK